MITEARVGLSNVIDGLSGEDTMLVLKRKIGETLLIPTCDLTLTVLSAKGTRAQVGISAPRSTISLPDIE